MKNPEDIMADYLLKGAKMLDKTCPECGSPLFTVKGDTFCVVCRETAGKKVNAPTEIPSVTVMKPSKVHTAYVPAGNECTNADNGILYDEIRKAVLSLCRRIENESRPKDCLLLMKSISAGIDALKKIEDS